MENNKMQTANINSSVNDPDLREIEKEDIEKNDGRNGNIHWVLIDGKVYDVTGYDHPGGVDMLYHEPGTDLDKYEEFESADHSPAALKIMRKFYIGRLKTD